MELAVDGAAHFWPFSEEPVKSENHMCATRVKGSQRKLANSSELTAVIERLGLD